MKNEDITICFDVSHTLVQGVGVDAPVIERNVKVLKWFIDLGCDVCLWSSGGMKYAGEVAKRLGVEEDVRIIKKNSITPDIAVDDKAVDFGDINLQV